MARIRTVKPELFKHEDLFDAEQETGLPLRLSFIGLFTCCDREGRFKWRPRTLKLGVLPHDDIDFSRVLDALWTRGFIVKYEADGEEYGCIPTFSVHQVVNNREAVSKIPEPDETSIISAPSTRAARVADALPTPAKGKGKEGKGREQGKEVDCDGAAPPPRVENLPAVKAVKQPAPTSKIWQAYSHAYAMRYGVDPVRNAKVNGQLAQLLSRLGEEEAVAVASWFIGHNDRWYVGKMHSVDCLLRDCEKLRTEWATGRTMTQRQATDADRRQSTGNMADSLADRLRAQGRLA